MFGFKKRHRAGDFAQISGYARFGKNVTSGSWTKVRDNAVIGDNVNLGDWAEVHEEAQVHEGAQVGSWAMVGRGAVIGKHAVLPDHTRVQPGVVVGEHTVFEGHELVTPDGIIPHRCSGFMVSGNLNGTEPLLLTGSFGQFEIPVLEYSEELLEDFFWGRSEALEAFRIDVDAPAAECEADEMPEM
jgi:UDP-3-O-[3-hydroxymyristoyl] glucosamine N-acyltransferase